MLLCFCSRHGNCQTKSSALFAPVTGVPLSNAGYLCCVYGEEPLITQPNCLLLSLKSHEIGHCTAALAYEGTVWAPLWLLDSNTASSLKFLRHNPFWFLFLVLTKEQPSAIKKKHTNIQLFTAVKSKGRGNKEGLGVWKYWFSYSASNHTSILFLKVCWNGLQTIKCLIWCWLENSASKAGRSQTWGAMCEVSAFVPNTLLVLPAGWSSAAEVLPLLWLFSPLEQASLYPDLYCLQIF